MSYSDQKNFERGMQRFVGPARTEEEFFAVLDKRFIQASPAKRQELLDNMEQVLVNDPRADRKVAQLFNRFRNLGQIDQELRSLGR